MKKGSRGRITATLLAVGLIVIGAIATAALAQDTGTTGTTGASGEATGTTGGASDQNIVFTWGDTSEPTSLNPMVGYTGLDFYFWTSSYHMLLDYDIDFGTQELGAIESGLVTDISYSDDLMHFEYTIRDDMVWSDGEPLTAEDVAFTMNMYKDNHAYLPQGYLTQIDGDVSAEGDTVVFDSKEPAGLYTGQNPYMYFYIVPEHVYSQLDKPKQFENVPSVGSGPFYIDEYQVGEFVRMKQNPFWTGPKPAIDEIVYRIYRNDDALATALGTGEIDFAYIDTPQIFNQLADQPNVETMAGTIPSFSEIGFNTGSAYQKADGFYTPHGDGHPALQDVELRRAMRMAISSEELNEKVLLGYGVPGDTIIPPISVPGARWQPEGEDLLAWDIDGANQLLDDAGYEDSDGDGVREMPADSTDPGRPLEFRYYVRTSDQTSIDSAPFVSEWLEQIGIKTEVQAVGSGRLGDIINAGTYDMFSWGWYPDPDPASELSYFTCDQRPPDGKTYGNNDSYYCNPEYDDLYQQQLTENDPEARMEIVHEMQKIYYEDAAYAVQWYDPIFSAWRSDRWEGFVVQPQPKGDPLEGWSGPGEVWWQLHPIGVGGTTSSESKGISAAIWAILVGVVVIAVAIVIARRRRSTEDEA